MFTRDIAAGEELFLHYGYDPRNCPSWYRFVFSFAWKHEQIEHTNLTFYPKKTYFSQGFSGHFSGAKPRPHWGRSCQPWENGGNWIKIGFNLLSAILKVLIFICIYYYYWSLHLIKYCHFKIRRRRSDHSTPSCLLDWAMIVKWKQRVEWKWKYQLINKISIYQ